VTLFATGTEVAVALAAAATLDAEGLPTRVISVPCFELFEQQDADYQASILGRGTIRVAIEAAVKQGWERFIGEDGAFIGMTGFGASAPAEVLYREFGITADAVVAAARARL
jgi:transketolase